MPTRQAGAHGSDAPKPSVDAAPNPRPVTVKTTGDAPARSWGRFVNVRAGETSSVTAGERCENETVPPELNAAADVRDSNQTPSADAPSGTERDAPPSRSVPGRGAGGVSLTATADDTAFIATADRPKTHRKTRESSTRNDDGPGAPSRVTSAPPAAFAAAGIADTTTGSSRY